MKTIQLESLKINPNNPFPFEGTEEQWEKFMGVLERDPIFCQANNITYDSTNDNLVIAGNKRLKAFLDLGFTEIPEDYTFDCKDWTEEQRHRYIVASNAAVGKWSQEVMDLHFEGLSMDYGISFGGNEEEEGEEEEIIEAKEDDFDAPMPKHPVTVRGDLYELISEEKGLVHRVYCGDSTSIDDVDKLMNGGIAAMITDPPYGIKANKQTLGSGKKDFHRGENWDDSIPDFFYLVELFNKSIIWGGNYFSDKLESNNHWLCWYKKNDGLSFSEFELAWTNLGKQCRIISHHWSGEKKMHPTMKPIPVMSWAISLVDDVNIFDPFLGSGTTLIASEQLSRNCYGQELDEKYMDVIVNRWIQYMEKENLKYSIKLNGELLSEERFNKITGKEEL